MRGRKLVEKDLVYCNERSDGIEVFIFARCESKMFTTTIHSSSRLFVEQSVCSSLLQPSAFSLSPSLSLSHLSLTLISLSLSLSFFFSLSISFLSLIFLSLSLSLISLPLFVSLSTFQPMLSFPSLSLFQYFIFLSFSCSLHLTLPLSLPSSVSLFQLFISVCPLIFLSLTHTFTHSLYHPSIFLILTTFSSFFYPHPLLLSSSIYLFLPLSPIFQLVSLL